MRKGRRLRNYNRNIKRSKRWYKPARRLIRPIRRKRRTLRFGGHAGKGSWSRVRSRTRGGKRRSSSIYASGRAGAAGAGFGMHRPESDGTQSGVPDQITVPPPDLELEAEEASLSDRDTVFTQGYAQGYEQGYFEGGEGRVSRFIPPYHILPELTIDDLIQAGIGLSASKLQPLLPPAAVGARLMEALIEKKGLSVVRLGDGELLTLAHDTILTTEEARIRGPFLSYAGVMLPDSRVRDQLVVSLKEADILGIPESRHPNFQGLLFPIFQYYGIDYRKLKLTASTINYSLNEQGLLMALLQGRNVLLAGNKAAGLRHVLELSGITVSGTVAEVNGAADVDRVMDCIRTLGVPFDIALVAAGIASVILCPLIAREFSVPAVDFGHLANKLENGEAVLRLP